MKMVITCKLHVYNVSLPSADCKYGFPLTLSGDGIHPDMFCGFDVFL